MVTRVQLVNRDTGLVDNVIIADEKDMTAFASPQQFARVETEDNKYAPRTPKPEEDYVEDLEVLAEDATKESVIIERLKALPRASVELIQKAATSALDTVKSLFLRS